MKEFIAEQFDLLALQLDVTRLFVVEAQKRSLAKPCRMQRPCLLCRTKRKILRERKQQSQ